MKKLERHSQVLIPPVHTAILQLESFAGDWLRATASPTTMVTRIERTARKASQALDLASFGHRHLDHLRRAKQAMVLGFNTLRFLYLRRYIGAALYEDISLRIDQILAGLESLEFVPIADWVHQELPSFDSPPADAGKTQIHEIMARIDSTPRPTDAPVRTITRNLPTRSRRRPRGGRLDESAPTAESGSPSRD